MVYFTMNDIYIIKNKINDKVYIGQTTKGYLTRFKQHCRLLKSSEKMYIHRAIKKHGPQNFYVELLETLQDPSDLDEREEYWIKKYDSYTNGYNLCEGGKQTKKPSKKIPHEIKEKILQEYPLTSIRQLSDKYKFNRTTIKNFLLSEGVPIVKKNKSSNNLTDDEKDLIQKLYNESYSTKEIADQLDRPERTVRRYRPKA